MTSLIEAAAQGDISMLEKALAAGENLEARNSEGDTALTVAAARGHVSAVTFLLGKGSDINAICDAGNSALHSAAMQGHADVVQSLLENGANKDTQNNRGSTALRLAAVSDSDDVIVMLLQNGANPNIASSDGTTPLMVAAYFEKLVAARTLLNAGVDPDIANGHGKTALMFAANKGSLGSVTMLLDAGAKVGRSGTELLTLAICAPHNSDAIALQLIEAMGSPSELFQGVTALGMAISNKRPVIVEALLAAGADPNQVTGIGTEGVTPLLAAVAAGDIYCTQILLKYGASPNPSAAEMTPMEAAMAGNHGEILQLLIASSEVGSVILPDSEDEGGAEIEGALASLIAQEWNDVQTGIPSTLPLYREQIPRLMNFARLWLLNQASVAAQVVIQNHVGVQRRRDEEKRAKKRCVEEIARLLIRGTDFYEDDDGVTAMAEFVLSRIQYRRLVELGRQSAITSFGFSQGDGLGYEEACRNELVAHGYHARKTPPTGDQGADLLANKGGITYAIQCKNYAGSVGNSAVQEAISAKQFYGTDNAVVVSDGQFTASARELAARAKVVLCRRDTVGNIDVVCATIA